MRTKFTALFLIMLFFLSCSVDSSLYRVYGENSSSFSPPSKIRVPVNVYLAGFGFSQAENTLLKGLLPGNLSYTYLSGDEEKTRYFYYGGSKINVLLENEYFINEVTDDEWISIQNSLLSVAVNSSVSVPVKGTIKTYDGFYLPVMSAVSLLKTIIDETPERPYNIVIFRPTISPLNDTPHWYRGNRYRTSPLGNYYDMRIGWSINNSSLFIDVGAHSWWLEESNPDELQLLFEAMNRNVTAVASIISKIVHYLIGNVPLSRVPILPVRREMRLSMLSIYNNTISRGSPYYLIGMDDLAKKTEELLPYFKATPKYYGMYKLNYLYPITDILKRNVITFNNVTFLNANSEVIKSLYVFFKDYVLPDTEKGYFNIFIIFFDLDVPIYRLDDGKLVEPTTYSSGMVLLDYYSVKHDSLYSDYQIRYSALRQIPPIFGIMSHSDKSAIIDFVQDPLSSYDMEKKQYISYSNFTRYAFARYFSILYNVSILYGLKDSHEYLQKYPFLKMDFSKVEEGLSEANELFRAGLLLKAAEKYFEVWDEYSVVRGKLLSWIVGIKATYFWGSVVLMMLSLVIVLREKKVEKLLLKELSRLISKGKNSNN